MAFQQFCRNLSQHTQVENIQQLFDLGPEKDKEYGDMNETAPGPEQSFLKYTEQTRANECKTDLLDFKLIVNLASVGFMVLSLIPILIHLLDKDGNDVKDFKTSEALIAVVVVLFCVEINILGTFIIYQGNTSRDFAEPEAGLQSLSLIIAAWIIFFILLVCNMIKMSCCLVDKRESSKFRSKLANVTENKLTNNTQNALNLNITYPASPKLSKSLNNGIDEVIIEDSRCLTLPMSTSYV